MPRNASLRLVLTLGTLSLGGCGYTTWWAPPFTHDNPNKPVIDSENMRRVEGKHVDVEPLTPEPGDIWPGPLPPSPTLQDLERSGMATQSEQPQPGTPLSRGVQPNAQIPPGPARGSSTPPDAPAIQPTAPQAPPATAVRPTPSPPPRNPAGQIVQSPNGPNVTTGGGPTYQTTVTPGGGSAIVVPNGNGTSTIIHADGRIETVTTPK